MDDVKVYATNNHHNHKLILKVDYRNQYLSRLVLCIVTKNQSFSGTKVKDTIYSVQKYADYKSNVRMPVEFSQLLEDN